jgi:F0F1-type ATP synthase membrane subunit b/b'
MINFNFWLVGAIVLVLTLYAFLKHFFFKRKSVKQVSVDRDRIVAEVQKDVNRIVEEARQEIQSIARDAERDLKERHGDQAMSRDTQTLQTHVTQDDQKRVVVRFIRNL